ncbi:MAG: hypothetical protein EOO73_35295 [Myxococcales bacterium]|nr:MAG: hypothetical protein EOO73_35295 [Myxococcales bacterium]
MPECDSALECEGEGLLCEEHSCAACNEDSQCEQYGSFGRDVCVMGSCEECKAPSDCPAETPWCVGWRCIQCRTNDDCASHNCNKARGRCEK